MYANIEEFIEDWTREAELTKNLIKVLTDDSLNVSIAENGRTIGRTIWHITCSSQGLLGYFGFNSTPLENEHHVPSTAKEIIETFDKVSSDLIETVRSQWTNDRLTEQQFKFGRTMTNGVILSIIIKHLIHHRGQLTVLMRHANLPVFGVYGPSFEEWTTNNMGNPPVV